MNVGVVLESAHWTDVMLDDPPTRPEGMDNNYLTGDYSIASGGTVHEVARHFDTNGVLQGTGTFDWKYAPDMSFLSEHDDYGDGNVFDITSGEDGLQIALALGALSDQADDGYWQETRTSQVKDVLHLGGKSVVGDEVLVAAGVGSGTEYLAATPFYLGLDFGELTVEGLGKTLGPDGLAYGTAAAGSSVSINLTAPVPYQVFNDNAGPYTLVHQTECTATGNTNDARTTIGIGELVDLKGMPANTLWSVSGSGTISGTNGPGTTFTASMSPGSATVTAHVEDTSLAVTFSVIAPTSISVISNWDAADEVGTEDVNGTEMGAITHYVIAINPQTVSFGNVNFREKLPPLTVVWPNGITNTVSLLGATNSISFPCGVVESGDKIGVGLKPISWIYNGTNYVNFSYSYSWIDQYQNANGDWVDFTTLNRLSVFRGSDKACHVVYQGVSGGWEGPFQ